ncbi:hypothetical protein [Brasilonema sp. UFV-L1]|uniref:hypothetical protein n=1 Tax=Brasilonema sp. UFV-L1 TaxID=2234130 RepID=UPI00145F07BC|nr:hypothetical protein [Brasilonema sp. UFV-L1]NMG11120.1 hypothetical protein [Brasilonema sp. UFV-L1]
MFTFKPFHFGFFVLSLLTMHLLAACGTPKPEVKDYTSTSCLNRQDNKLTKNVVTLASIYYLLDKVRLVPDYVQVKLSGKYATGQTEVLSDNFIGGIVSGLRYDGLSSYNVKMISLVEMPESIDKNQILKFSHPCQVTTALLDNETLRVEPSQEPFYLLASKKMFVIVNDGFYGPKPITPVKFKLRNPDTNQVEETTFSLHDIVNGNFIKAPAIYWGKREENQWRLNKHTQTINDEKYVYFTLTKESGGAPIVGEIQSIEFVLGE